MLTPQEVIDLIEAQIRREECTWGKPYRPRSRFTVQWLADVVLCSPVSEVRELIASGTLPQPGEGGRFFNLRELLACAKRASGDTSNEARQSDFAGKGETETAPMRMFYVLAESQGNPSVRQSALVGADDLSEALALVKTDPRFAGYRMPPQELSDARDVVDAAAKVAGDKIEPLTKGVHFVSELD